MFPHLLGVVPSNDQISVMFDFPASTAAALLYRRFRDRIWIMSHCDAAHAQLAGSSLGPLDVVPCKQMFVGLAWPQNVRGFAVDRVVACEELGFCHAEWDAEDVFDEKHDQRGPDNIPTNDEQCAVQLDVDLLSIAL